MNETFCGAEPRQKLSFVSQRRRRPSKGMYRGRVRRRWRRGDDATAGADPGGLPRVGGRRCHDERGRRTRGRCGARARARAMGSGLDIEQRRPAAAAFYGRRLVRRRPVGGRQPGQRGPPQLRDGKWGAVEWVWRGKQTKDLPGLPATNRPFQVRGASIVEFRDAKISRCSDYWDLATYMKQVGLIK